MYCKTYQFDVSITNDVNTYESELEFGTLSPEFKLEFTNNNYHLTTSANVNIIKSGNEWRVIDDVSFVILQENGILKFYSTFFPYGGPEYDSGHWETIVDRFSETTTNYSYWF